jgi:pyruvate dehydrogenase E2 component (dihydrolipoamide acetyltransferase)
MTAMEIRLPDLGDGLADAEIVEWLVEIGEPVREDQPIVSVSTDKAVVEIPSPAQGTLLHRGGSSGEVLLVGALLATIEVAEAVSVGLATDQGREQAAEVRPRVFAGSQRPMASPAVRRRATMLGIGLGAITGSGPGGRILMSDLDGAARAAAEVPASLGHAAPSSPAVSDRLAMPDGAEVQHPDPHVRASIRRQIARSMSEAWKTPHITDFREVDASELTRLQAKMRDRQMSGEVPLTYLPLMIKAVCAALRTNPGFNATFDAEHERAVEHAHYNIGIATATELGLIVPVVRNAGEMTVLEIAQKIADLSAKARSGRLGPSETSGGTITVSNFGSYGAWLGTMIIRPPEAAIVGFGRIYDGVVARGRRPVVVPVLPLATATDHRVNDGANLGAFVADLTTYLEDPALLLLGNTV